jgi:two-component sensor histidine kinase
VIDGVDVQVHGGVRVMRARMVPMLRRQRRGQADAGHQGEADDCGAQSLEHRFDYGRRRRVRQTPASSVPGAGARVCSGSDRRQGRRCPTVPWAPEPEGSGAVADEGEVGRDVADERLEDKIDSNLSRWDTFARLDSSFGQLRRFTADASHELRTPLAVIRGIGEMGLRETRTPAEYKDAIGSMLEEVDRLTRLVATLLRLSRGDARTVRLSRDILDLGDLVRDVAASLGILAEEWQQRLEVAADANVHVSADRLALRDAITNVVDNAIKYDPSGSTIAMRIEADAIEATLSVTDEGPGIPAEHCERQAELSVSALKGLREDGVEVPGGKPTAISPADVEKATHVFAIGCTLPAAAKSSGKVSDWSDVPDGQGYAAMRDAIVRHVTALLDDLQRTH